MNGKKKIILQYSITAVCASIFTLSILWLRNFWTETDLAQKYRILSDAFTVPGVILIMVSLLIWVSSEGFFDGITYALKQVSGMFIPSVGRKYKHVKYHEYKAEKKEKRLHGYWFLLFVGLVFVAIAVVFLILFNSVYVPKS